MIKPAKSKWPSLQITVNCRTCDLGFKMTIHYGESNIWGAQLGSKFAEWASHEDHDVEVIHEFYHGREMPATG